VKTRLLNLWFSLYSNFWFAPLAMCAAAVAIHWSLIGLDRHLADEVVEKFGWAYTGGAEGARAVLSVIASSMIAVAGVVFSITIVVLQLASSQFGPRLIREFMRDRGNQFVLGTFLATFLYCVLTLRTVRGPAEAVFVPHISIAAGVALAVASLGVLIYFIHHVARSIQVETVLDGLAAELGGAIERLLPAEETAVRPAPAAEQRGAPVDTHDDGYLQVIDLERLAAAAAESAVFVLVRRRPGEFVYPGGLLANVIPADRLTEELADRIRKTFVIGGERTKTQDLRFSFSQLAEVAVRALSPGVNDPVTAIACIERLGAALCRIAARPRPSAWVSDAEGEARVRVPVDGFGELLVTAFGPVREHARGSGMVTSRLLEALEIVGRRVVRVEDREALRSEALKAIGGSRAAVPPEDQPICEQRFARVIEQLDEPRAEPAA
jgi:uncharacterized membrane protein